MYTLSLLPSFLAFGLFAPLLLRLTLGIVLAHWGYTYLRKQKAGSSDIQATVLAWVDVVIGVLLILGLFTQAAALISAILLTIKLVNKARAKALFTDGVNYYFILFIVSVSLVFLGAGFLAFDLPL